MELETLAKNLRGFFLDLYKNTNQQKTFLAFEPLGHMLSPDDFKFNGQFDAVIAAEELSRMCDKVPAISDIFIADGTRTLSGSYGELLGAMQFDAKNITAPDKTPYIARFGDIKNRATFKYQSQASIEIPGDSIFLTRGSPNGWYDTNSTIWTQNSISQSTVVKTDTGSTGTPNPILWKVSPVYKNINENVQFKKIMANPEMVVKINSASVQQNVKVQANTNIGVIKNRSALTAVDMKVMPMAKAMAAPIASVNMKVMPMAKATTVPVMLTTIAPIATSEIAPLIKLQETPVVNRQLYTAMNVAVPFSQKVMLNREIGTIENIQTQEIKSINFQMNFSYALITLERSWILSDVFDNAKLWYSIMHKAGFYSTGDATTDNYGILRAIPKAMIVIKDLSITAQWSEEDRKAAVSSLGFGSFNIANSYFNNANLNQLIAPGVQIIGWICEVLPKVPFNDDVDVT